MQSLYKRVIDSNKVKPMYIKNGYKAFLIGGFISLIGQLIIFIYNDLLNYSNDISISLMVVTLIFISSLLTALGIYDKIGQISGAGSIIPITGFANSMTSSAMESRSEGIILGIGPNTFKLAGSVITFCVVSAYVFGIIRYVIEVYL